MKKRNWITNSQWYRAVRHFLLEKFTCLNNLWKWRKVICKDRWWDYVFILEILLFKLKDIHQYWGTSTHYQGDLDDKKLLEEMIEDLEWMVEFDNYSLEEMDNAKNLTQEFKKLEEEYKKRSRRFWGRMERHHRKFWD